MPITGEQVVPVTFQNTEGLRLFGMLHTPAGGARGDTAVLLLSPGVKMRVAPHRLYVKMAQRFVKLGVPVLRFDFHGLGDSEGSAPESMLADLYRSTQTGRYVSDTIAAMEWMQREHGISKFVAAGLCGGALTGLLAGADDPRIVGLLSLSIPVILDGSAVDAVAHMTVGQLNTTRAAYLRKLHFWKLDVWRSWVRFLTLRTDFRLLWRSLAPKRFAAPAGPEVPADNTNPLFAPAFQRMVATGRPVLLVFAEADRLYWEFQEKFVARHGHVARSHPAHQHVHVVANANHIFSFQQWQDEAFDVCCEWLGRLLEPVSASDQRLAPQGY